MTIKPHIIRCALCNHPTAISFEKPVEDIHCYFCAESIINFVNVFKKDKIEFIGYWDLNTHEKDYNLKHKQAIAVRHYINKLENEIETSNLINKLK